MSRTISRSPLAGSLLSVVLMLASLAARAQEKFVLPPVSDNAALQYWQAFAALPELDVDQQKLVDNWSTVPIDDAVRKLLGQSQTSLMFLHRAAKLPKCDWGLDYNDGVSMHLAHLFKARMLCRIAALDVRRTFNEGQHDVVGEDAGGMMVLARRVGADFTLVSMLVDFAIEGMVIDVVAPHLPELKAPYDDAMKAYNTLPPSPRLDHAIFCEQRMATTIIKQLQDGEKEHPGSWRETLNSIIGAENPNPFKNAESLNQVVKQMENFLVTYDELAQLVVLPPAEFDAKFPPFVERARAVSPVADLLMPAMNKVMAAQRRSEVRTAMLLAGIAVVESGPDKLAAIKDPFGDGPFAYRKLDEGFELTSKLEIDGKPVSLIVGQKATK